MIFNILTIIIATLSVLICYKQFKIENDKIRFELYNKRFKVYTAIKNLLIKFLKDARVEGKDISIFEAETNECVFLFNEDVVQYVELIRKKAIHFLTIIDLLKNQKMPEERRLQLLDEQKNLYEWFLEQFNVIINLFKKYLHIKNTFLIHEWIYEVINSNKKYRENQRI